MGKDDRIEALLVDWAQWLTVGDGSGYATMSVLHEDWTPPTPGLTPTMKTAHPQRARRLHMLIVSMLSDRLQQTLVVHYCQRLPLVEQAERLDCKVSTVHARVEFAHRELRRLIIHTDKPAKEFDAL